MHLLGWYDLYYKLTADARDVKDHLWIDFRWGFSTQHEEVFTYFGLHIFRIVICLWDYDQKRNNLVWAVVKCTNQKHMRPLDRNAGPPFGRLKKLPPNLYQRYLSELLQENTDVHKWSPVCFIWWSHETKTIVWKKYNEVQNLNFQTGCKLSWIYMAHSKRLSNMEL